MQYGQTSIVYSNSRGFNKRTNKKIAAIKCLIAVKSWVVMGSQDIPVASDDRKDTKDDRDTCAIQ